MAQPATTADDYRAWGLTCAALAMAAFGPALVAIGGAAPQPGRPTLAIAPPWVDATAAVEAAGGRVIALQDAPLATLAVFPDAGALARVRGLGVWPRDGGLAAAICGVRS